MSEPSSIIPYREVALVMLVIVALLLFLSMFSYSSLDASWSYAGSDLRVTNLIGTVGAWSADIAYITMGWIAYFVPISLVVVGAKLLFGNRRIFSWSLLGVRFAGYVGIIISGPVLIHLYVRSSDDLPAGSGGVLGSWIVNFGIPYVNWIGLTLIASGILAISIQVAFGVSWLRVFEQTGRLLRTLALKIMFLLVGFVRLTMVLGKKSLEGLVSGYWALKKRKKSSLIQPNILSLIHISEPTRPY